MDEPNNHQNSINHLHSQTRDRNMEQLRWPDLQTYVNQSPSMPTIPTGNDGSAAFPPNWIPGSSVQFLHPSGVLPYNLYMGPRNSSENATSNFSQSMSFFQAPSQFQNADVEPSQKSRKKKKTGGTKGKDHWNADEDVELCVAWLKISQDAIKNTSQRQDAFWERVTAEFNQLMKAKLQNHSPRSEYAAIARWSIIHPAVSKWTGLHANVTRNLESGWTVEQMESRARAMYQSKYKKTFNFERCWKVLRDNYKWISWNDKKNDGINKGTESVRVPPLSQDDEEFIDVDPEPPLTSNTEIPRPVSPLIQHDSEKVQNPLFSGPASRKKRRPNGVKKELRQREQNDQQTLLVDKISAALMRSDDKADERLKRQEALKRNRDDILDQRFEAQKQLQTRLVQTEHSITMENQKTPLLKDIKYIHAELLEAYKELKALNKSAFVIPEDQDEYDLKMEWIQMLKAQLAAKKRKLNLATSPVQSSEPQPSASDVCTSKITPRRLDDEDWSASHDV